MPEFVSRLSVLLRRTAAIVNRVIGVPDYDSYLRHMARAHPDANPVDQLTFQREQLNNRYSKVGSRCC